MSASLPFEFIVDKSAKTILINREFQAEPDLVWDAFTDQEILDQWWAPKPWSSRTKHMEFKVGGHRLYAMVSPEGQEHWGTQTFTAITPKTNFKQRSAFTDEDGVQLPNMPTSEWNLNFTAMAERTKVSITIQHDNLESLEKIIAMNFQGGMTMILDYLEGMLTKMGK
jgi:uncharacterized protein YndB with AHSA1/START domain